MNRTLEAIGQAIFRNWFVDFEFPNEKGRPYKSSGGEMVDSTLGKIPTGWTIGKLGDLGKIQPGFAFKSKDFVDNGIKIIKIRNIENGIVNLGSADCVDYAVFEIVDNKYVLTSGDVIIAMTGAELGKVGIIPKTNETMLLNQRVGKVTSNNKFLMYFYLVGRDAQQYVKAISSASSAQGNISNCDIENIIVVMPDNKSIDQFAELTTCLFNRLIENLGENNTLSIVRDSLLPRLMSGRIRIPVGVR
jgi:type I restriction enzyme S subunit